MTYIIIRDGLIIHCVSVNNLQELLECYPECIIQERVGEEDIGWTYDGVSFTRPLGG